MADLSSTVIRPVTRVSSDKPVRRPYSHPACPAPDFADRAGVVVFGVLPNNAYRSTYLYAEIGNRVLDGIGQLRSDPQPLTRLYIELLVVGERASR